MDFKITADGDLDFRNNDIDLVSGTDYHRQLVVMSIFTENGDLWTDTSFGCNIGAAFGMPNTPQIMTPLLQGRVSAAMDYLHKRYDFPSLQVASGPISHTEASINIAGVDVTARLNIKDWTLSTEDIDTSDKRNKYIGRNLP